MHNYIAKFYVDYNTSTEYLEWRPTQRTRAGVAGPWQ